MSKNSKRRDIFLGKNGQEEKINKVSKKEKIFKTNGVKNEIDSLDSKNSISDFEIESIDLDNENYSSNIFEIKEIKEATEEIKEATEEIKETTEEIKENKTPKEKKKINKKKEQDVNYKTVTISIYNKELEQLDKYVSILKNRGHYRMSRSRVIRYAINMLDISKIKDDF